MDQENKEIDVDQLKRTISSHPLYSLLLNSHLNCLKVGGLGNNMEANYDMVEEKIAEAEVNMHTRTELDLFMEAYCWALRKLKEEMEESQREAMAFVNDMHSQLSQLTETQPPIDD